MQYYYIPSVDQFVLNSTWAFLWCIETEHFSRKKFLFWAMLFSKFIRNGYPYPISQIK